MWVYGMMSLIMLMTILESNPFRSRHHNSREKFNEYTVLSIAYILLAFTDFVPTSDLRYKIGWV